MPISRSTSTRTVGLQVPTAYEFSLDPSLEWNVIIAGLAGTVVARIVVTWIVGQRCLFHTAYSAAGRQVSPYLVAVQRHVALRAMRALPELRTACAAKSLSHEARPAFGTFIDQFGPAILTMDTR